MPNKIKTWQGAGFSQEQIGSHLATKKIEWAKAGFSEDEINSYLGVTEYDPEQMKDSVQTYISQDEPDSFWDKFLKSFEPPWAERRARSYRALVGAEKANLSPSKFEPTLKEAFSQGYQQSVTGLISRGKAPDNTIPAAAMEYLPTSQRLAMQTALVGGDLPFMAIGGVLGGVSGGPAAPLTATGGAFALPAGMRKVYMDMYQKGQIHSFREFWQRMGDAVMETLKGEAIGVATAAAGASVPGAVGFAAEVGTMTTMGAAMEGTVPEPQDFYDAAILIGGLKGSRVISARLMNGYAQNGEHPFGFLSRLKSEPKLQEELLSSNWKWKAKKETFEFGDRKFDVDKAKKIIEETPRTVEVFDLTNVREPGLQGIEITKSGLAKADYDVPVIMGTEKGLQFPIDGWHRIAKAKKEGLTEIKKVVLDEKETLIAQGKKPKDSKTAEERVLDTISIGEGKQRRPLSETAHDLYTAVVDDLHPLNRVVSQMKKGEKVDAAKDPYKLARLFRGVKGAADHFLEHSPFTFKGKANVGKPLKEILSPFKDDLNGIRVYAKSKRAIELKKRGVEPGIELKDAREVVKNGSGKYQQAFKELVEYQDHALKYLRDSGLISSKGYKDIKQLNKDYTPFYRMFEGQKGVGSGKGLEAFDPLKKIKGSELATIDPLESIIKNTYLFVQLAEKNRIGSTLVKFAAQRDGLGLYVKKVKKPIKPIKVTKEELTKVVDKYTTIIKSATKKTTEKTETTGAEASDRAISKVEERVVEALESRGWSKGESSQIISRLKGAKDAQETKTIIKETIEKETERFSIDIPQEGLTIFRPAAFTPKENQIQVWFNGKSQLFEVHPEIARVFKGLDGESINLFTKIFSVPAKVLRAGAILSPEFIARNPIRDTLSAFIFSKWGFTPAVDFVRGAASVIGKDKFYRDWQKSGGMMAELTALDRKYLQQNIGQVVSKYPVLNRIKYGANPIEMLRVLSELSEQGTRVGEFKKARKKGATIEEAGFASREVTLDFARIGAKTRAVNSLVAFWNANVQGSDKMVRSFKDNPVATTAKVVAGITIPSLLLVAANHNDGRWDDIPRWQKDLFWIVMPNHVSKEKWAKMSASEQAEFSKDNHIWRIPKPFEIGILAGTVPERLFEAAIEDDPKAAEDIIESILRGGTPGGLPTVAIPIAENWAERSLFLDRPLIPAQMEGILPEYQYKNYTTEAAKAIGKLLGKLPALEENPNIAPIKIENIIRGWSGGLGMHVVRLASLGLEKTGVLPTPQRPTDTFSDWTVIKAFHVRYPSAGTESVNNFYKSYFSAKKRLDTFKYLVKKELNPQEALTVIANRETDIVRLDGIYEGISRAHQVLNLLHNHPSMTADEKRQLIDVTYFQMMKMATAGNKALKDIRKKMKEKSK